jgi:Mn-dependent DtxR family transcriptional regulator
LALKRYIERLRRIDFFLRTKSAGNIHALAAKLNLSRSCTLEYLKEMKELGFPIKYCFKRKIYYYEEDGKMVQNLFHKHINNGEMI